MGKKIINEIFLLRSIACLSLVLNHAIERSFHNPSDLMNAINTLLTFGTPCFIFISEFILSKSYPNKLPSNFWNKRVKYILVPYFMFGIFYAIAKGFEQSISSGEPIMLAIGHLVWRNIFLAEYHGYFIIIIFQFYLLHFYFSKYLQKWSPKWVIGCSLLINVVYLAFFNFVEPIPTALGEYIWRWFYWIPFFGWVFYFTVAYYSGRYYTIFIEKLNKYSKWVLVSPIIIASVSIIFYLNGFYPIVSSKKVDMLFFTMSMLLFIYFVSTKIKKVPKIIVTISQYSFGIYLFHPFFMAVMSILIEGPLSDMHWAFKLIVNFVGSTTLSILVMYLLNKIPYGYYLIGKVGRGLGNEKNRIKESKAQPVNS